MASIDYGVAHFFGLRGTETYMTIQSDSITESFALDVEVAGVDGKVITDRLDDRRHEITLDGVLKASDTLPTNGTQFTYNGIQYILKSIDDKGTNKDFRKVSVKGIKYESIA
jgi:hypothetical protein